MSKNLDLPLTIGDGLILRAATAADTEALIAFNTAVQMSNHPEFAPYLAAWTRDLLTRPHPTFQPEHFTVVEDTQAERLASALALISQTWSYDGIPFPVGRIELVGTHADYRRRGLVDQQFQVAHAYSAARGELVQAIAGIPWFYRQFGYEYALEYHQGRSGFPAQLSSPPLPADPTFRLRPATEDDVPFLVSTQKFAASRLLVTCPRDAAQWRYELNGRSQESLTRREIRVIESSDGEPAGFLCHDTRLWNGTLATGPCELKPGLSWLAIVPLLVDYLASTAQEYLQRGRNVPSNRFDRYTLYLGTEHPAYAALASYLPLAEPQEAWYLRVPNLPAFLRQIAPALEARLADSHGGAYSGELRLNFYRSGLRLGFSNGHLAVAEPWQPRSGEQASASFPGMTFLKLLFGYRSLAELQFAYPDCRVANEETGRLLQAIFPKRPSSVWGLT